MNLLEQTRALARAFKRMDKAEAAYRAAQAEFGDAFGQWAAGRSISRDAAREHLASTGHLEERKRYE